MFWLALYSILFDNEDGSKESRLDTGLFFHFTIFILRFMLGNLAMDPSVHYMDPLGVHGSHVKKPCSTVVFRQVIRNSWANIHIVIQALWKRRREQRSGPPNSLRPSAIHTLHNK